MTQSEKITCSLINHGLAISHDGKSLSPCCQYKTYYESSISWQEFDRYQTEFKPKLINELVQGNRVKECSHCWNEENIGYTSLRNVSNNRDGYNNDSFDTYDLEFRMGTHCNLACIMCSSSASSTWYTELVKHQDIFKNVTAIKEHTLVAPVANTWEDPEFLKFIRPHLATARRINLSGGEPLTMPGTLNLLDELVNLNRTDVTLQSTTNFSKIPNRLIAKLEPFENLDLIISLEGTGAMNDYLRYPSCWAEIENNIQRIKNTTNIRLNRVHHVLQHTSAYSLPPLIDWCEKNSMELTLTYVQGNQCLVPESIPPEDLDRFILWAKNNTYISDSVKSAVLNLKNTVFSNELFRQFREYVSALDQSRGTNYDKIFNPSMR
jgi:sulfatase maturation enzyme AslB (radical SAM superfamily)